MHNLYNKMPCALAALAVAATLLPAPAPAAVVLRNPVLSKTTCQQCVSEAFNLGYTQPANTPCLPTGAYFFIDNYPYNNGSCNLPTSTQIYELGVQACSANGYQCVYQITAVTPVLNLFSGTIPKNESVCAAGGTGQAAFQVQCGVPHYGYGAGTVGGAGTARVN